MGLNPRLEAGLSTGVFWVTRRIAVGRFATIERSRCLLEQGVTHILNVADAASVLEGAAGGFCEVVDVPITDLDRIPDDTARECAGIIHRIMSEPGTKLYVHCIGGQNRSPTVLWLYLIACGVSADDARRLIGEKSPDSAPGHRILVDDALVDAVRRFGASCGMDTVDPNALAPAY